MKSDSEISKRADSLCPVYEKARQTPGWQRLLSGPVSTEPKCGHFINRMVRNADNWTNHTIREYCSSGALFIDFLHDQNKTACDAEFGDVEEFFMKISGIHRAEQTYENYRTAIVHLCKAINLHPEYNIDLSSEQIYEWLHIDQLPSRERIERDPLSIGEVKKLLAAADCFRDRLMMQAGVEWGARNSSLRKLKKKDIDLDKQIVSIKNTKSEGSYTMPISDKMTIKLRHWLKTERPAYVMSMSNMYLFPSRHGGSLSSEVFSKIVREAAEDAGIQEVLATIKYTGKQKDKVPFEERNFYRVTPHTLRHTFNELLMSYGIPRELRSQALDHSSTEVTKEYYEHSQEEYHQPIREYFSDIGF